MSFTKNIKRSDVITLLIILLLHITCWFLLKPPLPHSDDLCYLQEGDKFIQHTYSLNESPKNHRLGIILPALVLTQLFGHSTYVVSLWSLLCSLATIAVLYLYLLKIEKSLAATASLLLSLNMIQVIYSTVLFPDIILAFFSFLFLLMVYKGRYKEYNAGKFAIGSALFFGVGFMTKEIILLTLPFCFLLSFYDLIKKSGMRFWIFFYLSLLFLTFLFIYLSFLFTGDFLFIYRSVEQNHNNVFVPSLSNLSLLKRLTYEPAVWVFNQYGYLFLFILALPSLIFPTNNKENQNTFYFFWKFYFTVLLLVYWWGTTSFNRMAPILLFDRMWMLLLVPLCIFSAETVSQIVKENASAKLKYLLLVLLSFGTIASLLFATQQKIFLFLFFIAAVLSMEKLKKISTLKNKTWVRTMLVLLPYGVLTFYFIFKNTNH